MSDPTTPIPKSGVVVISKPHGGLTSSGVAKKGCWGLNPHLLREKDIFNLKMLHFPFVTKITAFNITKPPIINSWLRHC